MRRSIAILSLVLAYVSMSLCAVIPHHHHGSEVCFGVELSEVVCAHSHCDSHTDECEQPHADCDGNRSECNCTIETTLHEVMNGSELRVDSPDWMSILPDWQNCCDECREAEMSDNLQYCHLRLNPYEAPDIRAVSLRAPPAV